MVKASFKLHDLPTFFYKILSFNINIMHDHNYVYTFMYVD